MEDGANILILLILSVGHAELWITLINRTHSYPIHEPLLKQIRHFHDILIVSFPLVLFSVVGFYAPGVLRGGEWNQLPFLWKPIFLLCGLGFLGFLYSTLRHLLSKTPRQQTEFHSEIIDIQKRSNQELINSGPYHYLAGLPFNQILTLEFSHKSFLLDRLPTDWDGLKILHLSDFHYSGTLKREFFREVCSIAQESQPDLVIFSGDLLDEMNCLDWLNETLGALEAPLGRYFILGNHDWDQQSDQIRQTLVSKGWADIASQFVRIEHAGHRMLIAGTEFPWMGQRPEIKDSTVNAIPAAESEFQLLVSHTPDNFHWAAGQGYDLMLSGHTHGGQVRIPIVGPVYSPSLHGTRYASGTFYRGRTLLHVSRGLSGIHPLRLFCRPEISLLTLHGKG